MTTTTTTEALAGLERAARETAQSHTSAPGQFLSLLDGFAITTPEGYTQASAWLVHVKGEAKKLEDLKKSITGPLTNATRNTNAVFAPVLDRWAEVEARLKTAIANWTAQERAARESAAATGVPSAPPVAAPGVSTRVVRSFRITDPDRVPRQFCSPDPAKIQAHLEAGGLEAIAGVEFVDEIKVRAARGAK